MIIITFWEQFKIRNKKNLIHCDFVQINILNYFSNYWILYDILYFYEIINLCDNRNQNFTLCLKKKCGAYENAIDCLFPINSKFEQEICLSFEIKKKSIPMKLLLLGCFAHLAPQILVKNGLKLYLDDLITYYAFYLSNIIIIHRCF